MQESYKDAEASSTKISVIVPVYNIPNEFLRTCFTSLVGQTLRGIEIIAIDDGSPMTGNGEMCDEFAERYACFRVIHADNRGVSAARNAGMAEAKGQWTAFVDADDWVDETMFERLYDVACATPDPPDIVVCDCYVEQEQESIPNHFFPRSDTSFVWNDLRKTRTLQQIFGRNRYYCPPEIAIGVPWAKLFRTSFLSERHLEFLPDLRRMQDNIFNLYAFSDATAVAYVPECLYRYRKFGESTSNRFSPKVIDDFEKVFRQSSIFLESLPAQQSKTLEQAYYSRVIQGFHAFFRFYFFHPSNGDTYADKKRQILQLLEREPYRTALNHVRLRDMARSMQLLTLLMRMHCFRLLGLLVTMRQRSKI